MSENDPHLDDDDGEYELQPVDPEILEMERQRAERKTREAHVAVDLDEVYEEVEQADPVSFEDLKNFRFTTRHLLIATAVLSLVLTAWNLGEWMGMFIVGVVTLAAGWFFVLYKERQAVATRERQRQEVEDRVAAQRAGDSEFAKRPVSVKLETTWNASNEPAFNPFSFSLKQLFGAMTAAAIFLALVRWLGGPNQAALMFGVIAMLGLLLHVCGFETPGLLILGWWLLLVMYILVSLWAVVYPSVAQLHNPTTTQHCVVFPGGERIAVSGTRHTACKPSPRSRGNAREERWC